MYYICGTFGHVGVNVYYICGTFGHIMNVILLIDNLIQIV